MPRTPKVVGFNESWEIDPPFEFGISASKAAEIIAALPSGQGSGWLAEMADVLDVAVQAWTGATGQEAMTTMLTSINLSVSPLVVVTGDCFNFDQADIVWSPPKPEDVSFTAAGLTAKPTFSALPTDKAYTRGCECDDDEEGQRKQRWFSVYWSLALDVKGYSAQLHSKRDTQAVCSPCCCEIKSSQAAFFHAGQEGSAGGGETGVAKAVSGKADAGTGVEVV